MSELIGHFPCVANELDNKNSCSSSDALAIYIKQDEDENDYYDGYCWSCHQSFFKNEISESSLSGELGIDSYGGVKERKFTPKPKAEPLSSKEVTSLYKELGFPTKEYRRLKPEWMKYFGVLVKYDNKGVANQVYYPEVEDKTVSGMKIRVLPKRFSKIGRTGLCSILGGQIKYKSPTKRLLIVAGENDGVASWGMLSDYYTSRGYGEMENVHVVWGTCGEGSLDKQLSKQYEFIEGYDEVIIGLDNDEAGNKALVKCLKILPSDKVKIAKWTLKDPHEMLERDKSGQFIRDFFNAKNHVDTGIKTAAEAVCEVNDFLMATKISLPPYLSKLQEAMRGGVRSTGAIINVCGDTSIGKSFFTDNLEMHWFFNSPLVPTIVSLERTGGELLTDMYSLYLKKNLTWFSDGHDAVNYLNRPDIKELCEKMVYDDDGLSRFNIIDERDGTVETLKKQVDRAIKQYNSKLIIFDPLTDFLRSLGLEAQEDFMMWQKMKKKEGVVFINVLHTRKPPQSKDGEFRRVSEYDVLGSGTFVQSADINIVLNRDKMAEDPIVRNTTIVDMPKCRGGSTGEICRLYYDSETRQQYDIDEHFSGRKINPEFDSTAYNDSDKVDMNLPMVDDSQGVVNQQF